MVKLLNKSLNIFFHLVDFVSSLCLQAYKKLTNEILTHIEEQLNKCYQNLPSKLIMKF